MRKSIKYVLYGLLSVGVIIAILLYLFHIDIAVLEPAGMIGQKQSRLFWIATWLMLIVIIPVLVLTPFIYWKYREGNTNAKYAPDWDKSHLVEAIWWGVPCVIIVILSVITWQSCHELDPFRPIASDRKPLHVQVVALQWKWLFIYPEEEIATVNYLEIPEGRPIVFEITADAPMNSFWIPKLGGQIYAMAGMKTKLHLVANQPGQFFGCSANLSGEGFSGMMFPVVVTSEEGFDTWVSRTAGSSDRLTIDAYETLREPSSYNPEAFYVLGAPDLFEYIVMKPMAVK
jgi:cytochrome o ubiquinol oxidase subunit 2